MLVTKESIVTAALEEWNYWGNSIWNVEKNTAKIGHKDDEKIFSQYIIDKYCSVAGGKPSIFDIQNDDYAWSAVGMSAIMKNAGFTSTEFKFSQKHSTFIQAFIEARIKNDITAPYWGYRKGEAGSIPDIGDLIGYARGENLTHEKAQKYFDRTTSYTSHTDVVVAKRTNEIDVIGANVLDSVTKKTIPIDSSGHISDKTHFWFVTLKLKLQQTR